MSLDPHVCLASALQAVLPPGSCPGPMCIIIAVHILMCTTTAVHVLSKTNKEDGPLPSCFHWTTDTGGDTFLPGSLYTVSETERTISPSGSWRPLHNHTHRTWHSTNSLSAWRTTSMPASCIKQRRACPTHFLLESMKNQYSTGTG